MKHTLRIASLLFIVTALVTPKAFAQHPVIFETFQEDQDLCPAPTEFQADMLSAAGAKDYSKVLHLNYHVGAGGIDPIAGFCSTDGIIDNYLNPAGGNANSLFFGSVNRITTENDLGINGSTITKNQAWVGDMSSAINAGYSNPPPDEIQLDSATLDKSTTGYTFKAYLSITATTDIGSELLIRYGILEDGVSDPVCSTATVHNDCVRYLTIGDSVAFFPNTSSGTVRHVTYTQTDLLKGNFGKPGTLNPVNSRFIAFIESPSNGVVDAIQLISNLDTIHAPPPTLSFNENFISGDTLNPGQVVPVYFNSTNLPLGVMAYFSTDNGTDWIFIADSQQDPFNWTVPDTLTTQGKFKLVAQGYPNLYTIEQGDFTIAPHPSMSFTLPAPGAILKGDSLYNIEWTKYNVGKVSLLYSLANTAGTFATFKKIVVNDTSTIFKNWIAPDTSRVVEFELTSDSNEAPATFLIDTIVKQIQLGGVNDGATPTALAITNVYPNPASNGQDMVIKYSEPNGKPVTLQVFDLLGQTLPTYYSASPQDIHLNTSSLTAGTYIVRITDGLSVVSKRVEIIR